MLRVFPSTSQIPSPIVQMTSNTHVGAATKSVKSENNLIWLDMEMTGLAPDHDRIIEVAVVVTDSELNILAEGPVLVIHQEDAVLDGRLELGFG